MIFIISIGNSKNTVRSPQLILQLWMAVIILRLPLRSKIVQGSLCSLFCWSLVDFFHIRCELFSSIKTTYLQTLCIWCTIHICVLDSGKTVRIVSVNPFRFSVTVISISFFPPALISVKILVQKEADLFYLSHRPRTSFRLGMIIGLKRPHGLWEPLFYSSRSLF